MAVDQDEVIGGKKNFWLYSKDKGFDLTHPATPSSPPIYPRIPLRTTKADIAVDPAKTALVVVDLQNYFLSPLLGRPKEGIGIDLVGRLLNQAIPACRKAGIPIVWLGWGLTQEDVDVMPPAIVKGFAADANFDGPRKVGSLGSEIGPLECHDGTVINGGRVLMRGAWNTAFYSPLADVSEPGDIWVSKNRLSGFWGGTGIEEILEERCIRTLLFSGANTDQCVAGSLQDAFTKGWDCLMLKDGASIHSDDYAARLHEGVGVDRYLLHTRISPQPSDFGGVRAMSMNPRCLRPTIMMRLPRARGKVIDGITHMPEKHDS
ncbi:Isochorismatase-like protein [Dactylonectria macrodidyma]|uniref:Isochorismatase-like protein n=1 Tax=Dactylonectria macrodidyma TaxID=307937 RepID=A0A9P9E3G9_9HYPO|nr:Isochorismatase-like protein [Dactylonectria macrodidyma]